MVAYIFGILGLIWLGGAVYQITIGQRDAAMTALLMSAANLGVAWYLFGRQGRKGRGR